ncbi:MAG TPA: HepT-like ribonuclease domain-containing protein [Dissulfurispiraceae bacterium]|nr:HepT-like ribonuclease domain-containing protein [Dissulfurispiraceae bacterium]
MSKRSAEVLADDMLEAIRKNARFTDGLSHDTFIADEKTVDAVVRNLEIIGEAAKRLPDEFKEQHAAIEWHKSLGFETGLSTIISGLTSKLSGMSSEQTCLRFRKI